MPNFEVTSPDGKRYQITAPEGATQEQALQYAQSQFGQKRPSPLNLASGPVDILSMAAQGPMGLIIKGVGKGLEGLSGIAEKAGSGVAEAGGRIGLPPEVAAGAGVLANMAVGSLPTLGAGAVAGKLGTPMMQDIGRSLMTSALKPSKAAVQQGKAEKAVETLLDYGVNVSRGGAAALKEAVSGLDDAVSNIVKNSTGIVDKAQVVKEVKPILDQAKLQLGVAKTRDEVSQAIQDFWNHPAIAGGRFIPVQKAHEMKRAFYKELTDKAYGKGVENPAYDAAEKAFAKGLKEGVGRAEPEVSPLLNEQSRLVNALKLVNNRLPTELNKNPLGLGWLGENALAAAGFMFDRSALLKSIAARAAYSGGGNALRLGGAGAGLYYGEKE